MTATEDRFPPDLNDLRRGDWLSALADLGRDRGFFEPLGKRHNAVFVEDGDTLLVSFETVAGLRALSDTATPLGFDLVATRGWSHLAVISNGDTWFRDRRVYGFFDQLIDDGFFDEFDQVIFFGAGPCGYAAAAYSVAAPGATVLALQPQATLDPRMTEWDDRFAEMRRRDFTDRFGYAPDMLDAAQRAYVLYDPRVPLDAMHAALFARPNVTRYRMPSMGHALLGELLELDLLQPLIAAAAENRLNDLDFARMMRARRNHLPYLRRLLARLETQGRTRLIEMLCRNVVGRMAAPRFRRKLDALQRDRGVTPDD